MEMLSETERARVRARDRKLRGPKVVVDNSGLKKVTMQVAERLRNRATPAGRAIKGRDSGNKPA